MPNEVCALSDRAFAILIPTGHFHLRDIRTVGFPGSQEKVLQVKGSFARMSILYQQAASRFFTREPTNAGQLIHAPSVRSPNFCCGNHCPCDNECLLKLKISFWPSRIKFREILRRLVWHNPYNRRQVCTWRVHAIRNATRVSYRMV